MQINLLLVLNSGKAYVQGYEVESKITQFLNVDKPRTFNSVVDTPIQTDVGNFVLVKHTNWYADINDFAEVFIYDDFISGSLQ